MTEIHDVPAGKSIRVCKRDGVELRAIITDTSVYPLVTDRTGFMQYPAWNPIESRFDLWEHPVADDLAIVFADRWERTMRHPSLERLA